MRKEVERGSKIAIAGAATTNSEVLILSVDDWYVALSMADGVKATVDEEGVSGWWAALSEGPDPGGRQ